MSGSTLKLIAIFAMIIDHVAAVLVWSVAYSTNNTQMMEISHYMRMFGRIAFPIFCFLLVEGFVHTKNRRRYAIRLALFAVISEIPFDLAFSMTPFDFNAQNVFFTLFLGLVVLMGLENIQTIWKEARWLRWVSCIGILGAVYLIVGLIVPLCYQIVNIVAGWLGNTREITLSMQIFIGVIIVTLIGTIIAFVVSIEKSGIQPTSRFFTGIAMILAGVAAAELMCTDYASMGVLAIIVMYLLRKNKVASMAGGCVVLTVLAFSEYFALVNVPLISLYNGKRGMNLKYLFYVFYPAHLLILFLIGRFIL
ncbi:TraX family protein [Anaeromicropila populeti]|uniref:TraX protein n=1 Tax=Anaeromicropila populeti TaxID=37658 RepID=A0A1I6KRV8_9FIRM|nr:TraX family protein [Anaeromicropila populeti]SFR93946.1 TraX protein [Anaeromicropila populeti]